MTKTALVLSGQNLVIIVHRKLVMAAGVGSVINRAETAMNLPPSLANHLAQLGITPTVKPPQADRSETGWRPTATEKEPPF